ncbi:hypothetical protein JCM11641_004142 [Rhodosporidiobolus odoratus]
MGPSPILEIINLVLLAAVAGCTAASSPFFQFYMWPSIRNFEFSTDVAAMSQTVGAASSVVSWGLFLVILFGIGTQILGGIAMLTSIVDCVCYGIWGFKGTTGFVCNAATSAAGEAGAAESASKYINCDASWMKYVLWGLMIVSGVLQLAVAGTAANSGGSSASQTLGKRGLHPTTTASTGTQSTTGPFASTAARSLGRTRKHRSEKSSRHSRRSRDPASDEEAALPLRHEKRSIGTRRGMESDSDDAGGYSDFEKQSGMGRSRRTSVSLSGGGGASLSDEDMGRLEGGGRQQRGMGGGGF